MLSKVKDIKVDVATYKSHKHAAAGFKREIEKQNDILAGVDQEIKDLHDEVTTKEQEKEDALQIIHEAGTLVKGTKAKENELANLRSSVTKQRSMLEEDFTTSHTIKDLREWLRDYDKSIKKKKELQEELQHQCHDIENEIESQRQKEMDLNSSKGKYLAEKDAHDNHVKERLKKMERLSQNYSVELQQSMTQQSRLDNSFTMSQVSMDASGTQGTTITLSKDDMDAFFSELDKKEESMKEEIRDHRASFREQENQLSAALTDLYGRKSSNVSDSKKLDTEQENIQRELSELQKITIKRMKKHMVSFASCYCVFELRVCPSRNVRSNHGFLSC